MKIFLSWSPNPPDPHYWKWLTLDGIVVSIATLKKRGLLPKALLEGLHTFLDYQGLIFLDSGGYEIAISEPKKNPQTQIEILSMANWLGADLVAHYDYPFIRRFTNIPEDRKWQLLKQSILNAKLTHVWEKNHNPTTQVVYVIQGWDEESIEYCASKLVKLDADYYALGSQHSASTRQISQRVKIVRNIIGNEAKLHLFAVTRLDALREVKHSVDSTDSSTPGIAGAMKEVFLEKGQRKHIDQISSFNCDCPVCRKFKGSVTIMGKEGKRNFYNKLRKIHNAYHLIGSLKKGIDQ